MTNSPRRRPTTTAHSDDSRRTAYGPIAQRPKTPQAASPCSWTCCRLFALPPHSERNAAPKPPTRGAWAREHVAEGTGRRHCRPAPAQGANPLRIPFWKTTSIASVSTSPKTAAGGRPLLLGRPPSTRSTAPFGTKRRTPAPCSWGGRSSTSSQRHWPSALPTTRGSWLRRRNRPCGRLRGWRNADLLRTRSA